MCVVSRNGPPPINKSCKVNEDDVFRWTDFYLPTPLGRAIAYGRLPLSPSDSSPNKLVERNILLSAKVNLFCPPPSSAGGGARRAEGEPATCDSPT